MANNNEANHIRKRKLSLFRPSGVLTTSRVTKERAGSVQSVGSSCDFDASSENRGELEDASDSDYETTVRQLDSFYGIVKRQIIQYQSSTTGMFPSSSDNTEEVCVRDSIYSAAAIWSLYQAYRRIDDDRGKSYELGQCTVKCMRGILYCWMQQSHKVEAFKKNQSTKFSLHSRFHYHTGAPVISDDYNHLQIDTPSLYILYLVQMIQSGLQIIYSMDEVNFIQNLVYYVERAYRTPDFGMWERGSKYNVGCPELHCSSIGMAKSALEAINGCNMFGEKGASWSVIYADIDAHNRNRSIFEALLPRESSSKSTDAALLPTISYPCFATHNEALYLKTKKKLIRKLKGEYGLKRFEFDGYKTVFEDSIRSHYVPGEIKKFNNVECQWPLFYIYLIIDAIFKGDHEQASEYKKALQPLLKYDRYGDILVPKYYYVTADAIEEESKKPGSQMRLPSREGQHGTVFLWGQSMYIISQLLLNGLIHINELDLIKRYLPSYNRPRMTGRYSAFQGTASDLVVQVVLIAESTRLQAMMATYGIQTQTPHEVEPVQIWSPGELVKVYQHLGVNKKLGLLGRPSRPIGSLGTSKIYRINCQTVLCYPLIFEVSDFYISNDMALLISNIKHELQFIGKYWRLSGRPTVCLVIREDHMRDAHFKDMLELLAMLKNGNCDGQKIRVGRLQNLLSSSCVEHLDFMHIVHCADLSLVQFKQLEHASIGYQSLTDIPRARAFTESFKNLKEFENKPTWEVVDALKNTDTMQGQSFLLGILLKRESKVYSINGTTVEERLKAINHQAVTLRQWAVVRYCTSLLGKVVDSISPYITTILVSGRHLVVGVQGQDEMEIDKPLNPDDTRQIIYNVIMPQDIYQAVLQQEIIVYIGKMISTQIHLFDGIIRIRIGCIINALKLYLTDIQKNNNRLESLSPYQIWKLVHEVFDSSLWGQYGNCIGELQRRRIEGSLGRVPNKFYERVWAILTKTPSGIVIQGNLLPQQPTISDMTVQDFNFAIRVEMALNFIKAPEYRQMIVTLIMVISTILQRNPELVFEGRVDLDVLLNDAFTLYQSDEKSKPTASIVTIEAFYDTPASITSRYLARAVVNHILRASAVQADKYTEFCAVS